MSNLISRFYPTDKFWLTVEIRPDYENIKSVIIHSTIHINKRTELRTRFDHTFSDFAILNDSIVKKELERFS